jgi:hypothetical protein
MNKQLIKQVAKVIGEKLAKYELSIVEEAGLKSTVPDADTLNTVFTWSDTPQGFDFWRNIKNGIWPYNYKEGKS